MAVNSILKYFRVWLITLKISAGNALANRFSAVFFITGKFLRFFFFLYLLIFIHDHVPQVAGYSLHDMITFFLVFNLFDLTGQIFFRGIYWFRQDIISGQFDYALAKPLSPLFQVLTKLTDFFDPPLFILVLIMLVITHLHTPLLNLLLFLIFFFIAFIIILSIHIIIVSIGIISTEVDHTIMIFRDLSNFARFPIDIYSPTLRSLLTFVIPIAVAYTFPAYTLLGLITPQLILASVLLSFSFLFFSLQFWRYALTQYSSASS